MPITRREVLWGMGGGLAGLVASPVPWKLLDDVSIWTQHRHALPIPAAGEVSMRHTACPLCPAGCALGVRLVGPQPVAVTSGRHPLGGGACPLGLTAHHLAHHPLRLTTPARRWADGSLEPLTFEGAVAAVARAVAEAERAGQTVVVVDRRLGRVDSAAYRAFLGTLPRGVYCVAPGEGDTLRAHSAAYDAPTELGLDLDRTRTLLSFGSPVFDGWGRPGRMWTRRPELHVIQIDTWRSPTAALADESLIIRPGTEGALVLALTHVLVREGRKAPRALVGLEAFAPGRVAASIGLEAQRIEALARRLGAGAPTVVIGGGDPAAGPLAADVELAIANLNVVLGSVGVPGGVVPRLALPSPFATPRQHPTPEVTLAAVGDASVGVLLLDGADAGRALPWSALEQKLAPGALVVHLSPFQAPTDRHAALLLPGPAPLEAYTEVLPTLDRGAAAYAVGAPILTPPSAVHDTPQLLRALAEARQAPLPELTGHVELLKRRVGALHALGRGTAFQRQAAGYAEVVAQSAEQLWELMSDGGCWVDVPFRPSAASAPRGTLNGPSAASLERWSQGAAEARGLTLVVSGTRGTVGAQPVSPLLSKLYQESDLRCAPGTARLRPETARRLGFADGDPARLESTSGAAEVRLVTDGQIPADRIVLAVGPALHPEAAPVRDAGPLSIVTVDGDGTWRRTDVRLQRGQA